MKVVITGAGGFLGSELVSQLKKNDSSLKGIVAVSSRSSLRFPRQGETDVLLLAPEKLMSSGVLNNETVLVNCGFPRNGDISDLGSYLNYADELFRTAEKFKVRGIVNISSQSVYNPERTIPATETSPVCPRTTYGLTKYSTELLLRADCSISAFTNIRLTSLIGSGFDQRVPNRMVKQALSDGCLTVRDSGSCFGYMDVRDAAAGLAALIASDPDEWQETYNLGRSGGYTLPEIANEVVKAAGRLTGEGVRVLQEEAQEAPCCSVVDASLFCAQFDFTPRYSLADSVSRICASMLADTDEDCSEGCVLM